MYYKNYSLFLLLIAALLIQSCGSSSTVTVVPEGPRSAAAADTTIDEDTFRQLTIGVIDPVTNFDPLFAEDLSTMRVLSLIYDGLFTLSADGSVTPALAASHSVSDDRREYVVQINRDHFFHDSNAFVSGVGRRIHANDIKWAFERTALVTVPEHAGNLLMNIEGYERYFLEQRNIYDTSKRVVSDVSGIEVRNADTVIFRLKEPDSDFLKKLASPYLFIYPREALQRSDRSLSSRPVGTGLYSLRDREENRIIFSKRTTDESLNRLADRIDIIKFQNEGELFQQFILGNVDFIPEVGPSSSYQLVSDEGDLVGSYRDQFKMTLHNSHRLISLYLNSNSSIDNSWLQSRLIDLNEDLFEYRANFVFNFEADTLTTYESQFDEYYIRFTDDIFARSLFSQINSAVLTPDASLNFVDIRVVIPEISLYSRTIDSFHQRFFNQQSGWLTAESEIVSVYQNHISGIEASDVPWLIDVRNIRISASQQ